MKSSIIAFLLFLTNVLLAQTVNQTICDAMEETPYDSSIVVKAIKEGGSLHCACLISGSHFSLLKSIIPTRSLKWRKKYSESYYNADPLVVAYENNNWPAIKHLLNLGADPFYEPENIEAEGLFRQIILSKDLASIDTLKAYGVPIDNADLTMILAIFSGAQRENLSIIEPHVKDWDSIMRLSFGKKDNLLDSLGYDWEYFSVGNLDIADPRSEFKFLDRCKNYGLDFKHVRLSDVKSKTIIKKCLELGSNANTINLGHFLGRPELFQQYLTLGADPKELTLKWSDYFNLSYDKTQLLKSIDFNPNNFINEPELINQHPGLVIELVNLGLDANKVYNLKDHDSTSILLQAIGNTINHVKLVNLLLQKGADPNRIADVKGKFYTTKLSPLNRAMESEQYEIAILLVKAGANPNKYRKYHNDLPLLIAVENQQAALIEILVNYGADPDRMTLEGDTPWKAFKKGFPKDHPNYLKVKAVLKKARKS